MAALSFAYNKETFPDDMEKYTPGLPVAEDSGVLKKPVSVNGRAIKNRIVAHPIEGCDALEDGSVSESGFVRYGKLAAGGSGMIWAESTAVDSVGRTNARQLWIRESNVGSFAKMAQAIHENGCGYCVLQLTHAGRNSQPDADGYIPCAFDNPYLPQKPFRILSDGELEDLIGDYVRAASLAEKAGFDAVDVRVCHGYLLNELLAGYTRPGKYGGSYENRVRLIHEIIEAIRRDTTIDICVRLNSMDGIPYPYGWGVAVNEDLEQWKQNSGIDKIQECSPNRMENITQDLTEPLRLVRELKEQGVTLLDISAGIGAVSPWMIRPYDKGVCPPEHPLDSVYRLLRSAKEVKEAVPQTLVIASGFTWLRDYAASIAAGGIEEGWFDFAGFGRASVADPAFAYRLLANETPQVICNTCGGCTGLIKKGAMMRCVRS